MCEARRAMQPSGVVASIVRCRKTEPVLCIAQGLACHCLYIVLDQHDCGLRMKSGDLARIFQKVKSYRQPAQT